jgi:predicted glycoside hydrolase/deacetylase ChbG (UPF0249 family)
VKRILIINADDLGYTRGVNRAVVQCVTKGLLRNATVMANGEAFQDAIDAAASMRASCERFGVGVHLVLTELSPVARPEEISDLLDDEGLLPKSPTQLFAALHRGKIKSRSLFRELDQQVAKVVDHGVRPTHLDSHKHVHVLPQILDVVIRIARKYSIRWIRRPFDRTSLRPMIGAVDPGKKAALCKQHLKARLIEIYRPAFLYRIRHAGMRVPDHFFGISLTGLWNERVLVQLLRQLPTGTSEWMFHPGDCDGELRQHRTRLLREREVERDLLLSPVLEDLLNKHGVTLESYSTLL